MVESVPPPSPEAELEQISTHFYKKQCPKVEIGPGAWFFAFPSGSTMCGAGGKNPRFFEFFPYFFGNFENRSSRTPVGKSKFPL